MRFGYWKCLEGCPYNLKGTVGQSAHHLRSASRTFFGSLPEGKDFEHP